MAFIIDGLTIPTPSPGNFSRETIELKAEHMTLAGKSVKDVFGIKERYLLLLDLLTKTESDNIYDKFDDKAVKNFTVNETNLAINTNVLISVRRREYNVPGSDLRVDMTLDLIEETAT